MIIIWHRQTKRERDHQWATWTYKNHMLQTIQISRVKENHQTILIIFKMLSDSQLLKITMIRIMIWVSQINMGSDLQWIFLNHHLEIKEVFLHQTDIVKEWVKHPTCLRKRWGSVSKEVHRERLSHRLQRLDNQQWFLQKLLHQLEQEIRLQLED